MERKKKTAGLLALTVVALCPLTSQTIGDRACIFLKEFEKVSSSAAQVSLQERVIYSLIEAKKSEQ